jgi:hypothetical protein
MLSIPSRPEWKRNNKQQEFSDMCSDWVERHEDELADINARKESLGGQLDLDGRLSSDIDQYNLDVDRFNLECAGEETNYYEENR